MNGIELEDLSNNLAGAISHAFAQLDIGLLTDGGALPTIEEAVEEEVAEANGSCGLSNSSQRSSSEYVMSGALPVP